MKTLITAPGSTVVVSDVSIPEPGVDEIRVKVHSLALNPIDPLYAVHQTAPPGRVVGEGVTGWSFGDRVAGFLQGATSTNPRPGSFAEFAILEADLTIHIPNSVSFEEAATVLLCSLTVAQALFIRLGLNAPFSNPLRRATASPDEPAILIYSATTSVGLFAIELIKISRTPSGKPYRIFATASQKHHEKLLSNGVEAVFDYRSATWPEDVRKASGGISYALDCISEDDSTVRVSQTFVESGGVIAVIRKAAWNKGLEMMFPPCTARCG